MRKLAVLSAVLFSLCVTSPAQAKSEVEAAKARYYRASGIVKWIGNHAKHTQYHPDKKIKQRWQAAVHYWRGVRIAAWQAMHPRPAIPGDLAAAFLCIHRYEGSWTANTGNGYYGGLQMDYAFQSLYGGQYLRRWGTADNWPVWAQLDTAVRAYRSGRGFYPWPNTARVCGLI